jgi:hypothetical protein
VSKIGTTNGLESLPNTLGSLALMKSFHSHPVSRQLKAKHASPRRTQPVGDSRQIPDCKMRSFHLIADQDRLYRRGENPPLSRLSNRRNTGL